MLMPRSADPRIVLIEFSADWCAACQPMGAIIEQIAIERVAQAHIARVDVAAHPSLAERFDVHTLPTSIVFVEGLPSRRVLGACTKRRLFRDLDEAILEAAAHKEAM